jgi:7-carboxy-7-deazaguanine synthase
MLDEDETRKGLLLSEIFSSIQGEGVNLGTPSVFLRLAICNLHCWYCDTKYTWLYNENMLDTVRADLAKLGIEGKAFPADLRAYNRSTEVREVPIEQVESKIRSAGIRHLVVTGGEPMLQQIQLVSLLRKLRLKNSNNGHAKSEDDFFVEVETNGTIRPIERMLPLVDQWNVSPKLESSGNSSFAREKGSALKFFASMSNVYFKFVVSQDRSDRDLGEIELLSSRHGIHPDKIILMAEGTEASVLKERTAFLSKVCKKRGYRVTPRLQILLWGNQRGT